MDKARIDYLMKQHCAGLCSPEELQEFYAILNARQQDAQINELLLENWLQYSTDEEMPEAEKMFNNILSQAEGLHQPERKVFRMNARWRLVAAACVIVVVFACAWLLFNKQQNNKNEKQELAIVPAAISSPDKNRAVITLANGKRLYLDSIPSGTSLTMAENEQLTKTADGEIIFKSVNDQHTSVQFNTLVNPRGSRIAAITLPDGSRVWLNAATTIKYFSRVGTERKVDIEGEAYFEVAHSSIPFIVTSKGTEIHDLGTAFNVNAYQDETQMKVTLLEGAVLLKRGPEKMELKPGQQASVDEKMQLTEQVNLDAVMAWKNGRFWFGEKTDIKAIMRQISRWYNVDVEYKGAVKGNFGGAISRNANLEQVLKILETTGEIHYKFENNKIIIMP